VTLEEMSRMECSLRWWSRAVAKSLTKSGHHMSGDRLLLLARMGDGEHPVHWIMENAYFGTNASYTLHALVAGGYLTSRWGTKERKEDRRERFYSLTDRGRAVRSLVMAALDRAEIAA